MFGFSTFSQSPFSSLGTQNYVLSLTENVTLADVVSILASFPLSDTENITMADSSSQTWSALQSITENTTLNDVDTITAQFAGSISAVSYTHLTLPTKRIV